MEAARPATPDDVDRLAELAAEALAEQSEGRGGRIWSQREAREVPAQPSLVTAMADPDQLVLVATIDEYPVGYTVAGLDRLRTGAMLGVVHDIYVEPEARAVGCGEALIDQVTEWCRGHGCIGIDALALPGNRATKNFFETFGLVARAIVVHRSLEPPV